MTDQIVKEVSSKYCTLLMVNVKELTHFMRKPARLSSDMLFKNRDVVLSGGQKNLSFCPELEAA